MTANLHISVLCLQKLRFKGILSCKTASGTTFVRNTFQDFHSPALCNLSTTTKNKTQKLISSNEHTACMAQNPFYEN